MAIRPENYKNIGFWDVHNIQKVYIEDYNLLKLELAGVTPSDNSLEAVASCEAKKDELRDRMTRCLEDINALGSILDLRDGTISTDAR